MWNVGVLPLLSGRAVTFELSENANFTLQCNISSYIRWIEHECGSILKGQNGAGAVVIFFSSCH